MRPGVTAHYEQSRSTWRHTSTGPAGEGTVSRDDAQSECTSHSTPCSAANDRFPSLEQAREHENEGAIGGMRTPQASAGKVEEAIAIGMRIRKASRS